MKVISDDFNLQEKNWPLNHIKKDYKKKYNAVILKLSQRFDNS